MDLFAATTVNTTVIDYVRVVATGTTTAGMVRIFYHDGTNYNLIAEIPVGAFTPSATVQVFTGEHFFTRPLKLPSGKKLGVSTHNAEAFECYAMGGKTSV